MKVLVVEDDPDQLAIRGLLLQRAGFETTLASDGASALRAAAAEHPDCALLDLRLPAESDGLALIRELTSLSGNQLPILVLTGADLGRFQRKPEHRLVSGVIKKGSSSRDLIEKLKAVPLHAPQRPA